MECTVIGLILVPYNSTVTFILVSVLGYTTILRHTRILVKHTPASVH